MTLQTILQGGSSILMFDSFEAYDVQETRRVSREEGEQLYLIKQIIKKIQKHYSIERISDNFRRILCYYPANL